MWMLRLFLALVGRSIVLGDAAEFSTTCDGKAVAEIDYFHDGVIGFCHRTCCAVAHYIFMNQCAVRVLDKAVKRQAYPFK